MRPSPGRVQTTPPPSPDSHHVVDGAHVAHVVGQQAAHLLLPPVSRGVQRRPPVAVPAAHVHAALQQHPAPGEAGADDNGYEDFLEYTARDSGPRRSLQDFDVAFCGRHVQSGRLGVWVGRERAAPGQHGHGVLQHDPLLFLPGLIHIYS